MMGNLKPFLLQKKVASACADLSISVSTPTEWQSQCPKLYFPLDRMAEGIAFGPDAASDSISIGPGKMNASLHCQNPAGNLQAGFRLGHYPSTHYCFAGNDSIFCLRVEIFELLINN